MRKPKLDDPDLPLDTLMKVWPETIAVFLRHKMLCVGCVMNSFRTVIDTCDEYGLDEEAFRAELMLAVGRT